MADVQAVQVDIAALRHALEHDREMFFQFFLHDKLTLPVPQFHMDIFDMLIHVVVDKFALAVPRGHAKTTIVKLAVVWLFLFSVHRFVVYCSNTTTVAKDECRDIINFLESENFIAVFGRVEWEKKNESDGLYIFWLRDKRCILRALGANQQVRGLNIDNQRPEILVADDAEDDENTATPAQRNKFWRWVFGPLFKACARHSKKIWIGNLVSATCILDYFCNSEHWASVKYGCIKANGEPLWPEMFSLEYLRNDFKEYCDAGMQSKWFAEMMNLPVPEGMGLIQAGEILYKERRTPGDISFGFITVDPAFSKKTTADNSAIVVHGFCEGHWQVVDYMVGKLGLFELFAAVYRLALHWKVRVIGIESVQAQAALITMFAHMFIERGMHGYEVLPLMAGGVRKTERIMAWCALLKDHTYTLNEGDAEVVSQLMMFDPTKDNNSDDLIDACAYGPQVIAQYIGLVMNRGPEVEQQVFRGESQICTL